MSGINNVVLVGRLTKDPELKYIPGSGTAVSTSAIAIDRDYKKDGQAVTDFIPIEVMGKPAEFMANYCSKGRLVALQGRIQVENYQDQQGNKRSFTKVLARNVQALDSGKEKQQLNQGFQPTDDDLPF